MRIGLSTGYLENYWGDWFTSKQIGGSEHLVVQLSVALAQAGHAVTVRLPYPSEERVRRGVRFVGHSDRPDRYDLVFAFDDYERRDAGDRRALVVCRSDPPRDTAFDQIIFLSKHHARLMGHPSRPSVGGGVSLDDYEVSLRRIRRRVICTSSPDRCAGAATIGRDFDFVHSYRRVGSYPSVELDRQGLVELQQTAQALIYPYDPTRESDFFSMAVLECMAAGTPAVISDGPSLVELWGDAAIVLPRPIDFGLWSETVERVLTDRALWRDLSDSGRRLAASYQWSAVAERYLQAATS